MFHGKQIVYYHDETVFWTIFSGVVVFLLGQLFLKFLLEPVKEFKGIVGKIDNQLKYYANIIFNSSSDSIDNKYKLDASESLRKLSCDFESAYKQIPFKSIFSFFGIIPDQRVVSQSATTLIRSANFTISGLKEYHLDKLYDEIKELRKNLKIEEL